MFEDFPVPGVRDLHGSPVMEWTDGDTTWPLTHRRDFTPHLATAELPETRTGRLATSATGELSGCWLPDSLETQSSTKHRKPSIS